MGTKKIKNGFSLIEVLVVISILSILAVITIISFSDFNQNFTLSSGADQIANSLRLAQSKTLASEQASSYGVYFDQSTNPHQYILFQGNSFDTRDSSFDRIVKIADVLEILDIDLGGTTEVVFNRITGTTLSQGLISIGLKSDTTKTKTIYIEASGAIGFTEPLPLEEGRIEDSRHVHFLYNRTINTNNENIILTFDGSQVENVNISNNMKQGQIFWEGDIDVGGESQRLKIQTHNLNNPNTIFSIHRDRRYNTKSLEIEISGDGSGYLINYNPDGLITNTESVYVGELLWQ